MRINFYSTEISPDCGGIALFDRDGTLITNEKGLKDPSRVDWLPNRLQTLRELQERGVIIAIATNQGAVEEGLVSIEEVVEIHNFMASELKKNGINIFAIAFCPHSQLFEMNRCWYRKPNPGLLDEILTTVHISPELPIAFFGDSDSDLKAAIASSFEIQPMKVSTNYFSEVVQNWMKSL